MRPIKVAIYGSCHAKALETLLSSDRRLAQQLEFVPVEPCMNLTDKAMEEFLEQLPSLDVFMYQPVSAEYRGREFSTSNILERSRPHTRFLSFSYYHFEAYTPYITSPNSAFPQETIEYADYLLGSLIKLRVSDDEIIKRLMHFEEFWPYAPAMLTAAMSELRLRENRVLPGDRPLDVRIADRVESTFRSVRLGHTNNHPGATVFGWLASDITRDLDRMFGLGGDELSPVTADPLAQTSFCVAPFIKQAYAMAFEDQPSVTLRGRRLALDEYVIAQRRYFDSIPDRVFWKAAEDHVALRPWYEPLLGISTAGFGPRAKSGIGESDRRTLEIRINEHTPPGVLGAGWSTPEATGVWSDGFEANLCLAAPEAGKEGVIVEAVATAYVPPMATEQTVAVSVGGEVLADWIIRPNLWLTYRVIIPAEHLQPGKSLEMKLTIPGAAIPEADPRRLGMALQTLTIWY